MWQLVGAESERMALYWGCVGEEDTDEMASGCAEWEQLVVEVPADIVVAGEQMVELVAELLAAAELAVVLALAV